MRRLAKLQRTSVQILAVSLLIAGLCSLFASAPADGKAVRHAPVMAADLCEEEHVEDHHSPGELPLLGFLEVGSDPVLGPVAIARLIRLAAVQSEFLAHGPIVLQL